MSTITFVGLLLGLSYTPSQLYPGDMVEHVEQSGATKIVTLRSDMDYCHCSYSNGAECSAMLEGRILTLKEGPVAGIKLSCVKAL